MPEASGPRPSRSNDAALIAKPEKCSTWNMTVMYVQEYLYSEGEQLSFLGVRGETIGALRVAACLAPAPCTA